MTLPPPGQRPIMDPETTRKVGQGCAVFIIACGVLVVAAIVVGIWKLIL